MAAKSKGGGPTRSSSGKARKSAEQAPIEVVYHPLALAELSRLPDETRANVLAQVSDLNGKTHSELISLLDPRTERKVFQWEGSDSRGTLRIIFSWGRGKLWMIAAFVKNNDAQGERAVARILPRVAEVQ